jgi:hypothetical protein
MIAIIDDTPGNLTSIVKVMRSYSRDEHMLALLSSTGDLS